MDYRQESTLQRLVETCLTANETDALIGTLKVLPTIIEQGSDHVSRAVLAQAMNLMLFRGLLMRVPTGARYVAESVSQGRQIVFDHGALRTVALRGMGNLPSGERAITRVLLPLGYSKSAVYPLDRLGMTGHAYTHNDFPEDLPQFFVSELHPERFSPVFQKAAADVTVSSRDPLTVFAQTALDELSVCGLLHFEQAKKILPILLACFQRQHADPLWTDYVLLLRESAEMAWISTEGNTFNHATNRVACLDEVVAEQRRLGRPLKDSIETSRSGRIRQTAFRADTVERNFIDSNGAVIRRTVTGSFYEFIQRAPVLDAITGVPRLDLAFDSGNAQGIFKMTAAI